MSLTGTTIENNAAADAEAAGGRPEVHRTVLETPTAIPPAKSERLLSLDVFRGITIAGMILVNNPGSGQTYAPLEHAPWDGWTPTDFIFPFFLFMVGVAMTLSFDKRLAKGASVGRLLVHVFARSTVLFLLGMILAGFPNFRLITPYILTIAGIQFLFNDTPENKRNRFAPAGWGMLIAGLIWFVVDFRYFNGLTARSGFKYLFPLTNEGGTTAIRVPGVLQRIALCYMAASLIMVTTKQWRGRLAWSMALLAVYWVVMRFVHAPAGYVIGSNVSGTEVDAGPRAPFPGGLNDWIDVKLLGKHLYRARPDPEGLLSTIPAIATTLLGILTGMWMQKSVATKQRKSLTMFGAGVALLIVGQLLHPFFPINKKIWTSSYVIFMAGWALVILSACYYVIDVKGYKKWSLPFLVLGTNAILAFFGSGILARLMSMTQWGPEGHTTTLRRWLWSFYEHGIRAPKNASLAWALSYVTLWVLLITPLYRKKIFLKV